MAFEPSDLALLSQGRGFGLWHYRLPAADGVEAATASGYFGAARHLLRVGDLVLMSKLDGSAAGIATVNQNAGGVVDLADSMSVLTSTLGTTTAERCDLARLAVLAYANGFTLWHYHTDDEILTTEAAGYWNPARGLLQAGDLVLGRYRASGSPRWAYSLVRANDGTAVTMAEANSFF
jgi:predicted lipoprotein with Yx(FWY)xxD motif